MENISYDIRLKAPFEVVSPAILVRGPVASPETKTEELQPGSKSSNRSPLEDRLWIGALMWVIPPFMWANDFRVYVYSLGKTQFDFLSTEILDDCLSAFIIWGLLRSSRTRRITAMPIIFYSALGALNALRQNLAGANDTVSTINIWQISIFGMIMAGLAAGEKSRRITAYILAAAWIFNICVGFYHDCASPGT